MANRFFNPNEQFADASGIPYAGGSLAFFASGTSTPLNTFSDSALSIANTNPVVLDSAGRANSVFLQNLAYKVVLSDVNNNLIWTEDPVYASDYSTRAKITSGSGSPNGSVAGTAGSTGIGADTYWDIANNILYVCTVTGTTSTAVWTAVNATAAAAIVPNPQGYLTPTSGTPIIPADVISATSLVYTPYVGNIVPIYNGTGFTPTVFSELTLTLTASHALNTIYDVFVFNNSGVLTLVTGPSWSNSSAGTGARGTGAGTTQISRLSGIWVNTVQISGKNGANTFAIPANQATYLGSIFIDGTAGQITLHRSFGQARKWAIWNAYNRVPIILQAGDSTANWSTAPTTFRQSRGDANNFAVVFAGLPEEEVTVDFTQAISQTANTSTTTAQIAIGLNSTSAGSGMAGIAQASTGGGSTLITFSDMKAKFIMLPNAIGINNLNMLEAATSGTTNNVFEGTATLMLMTASYRG
jgi:hypothetical protein